MTTRFPCPYLNADVELSEDRERHIAENHPDLLPEHRDRIGETLADPDEVRRSKRMGNASLFSRWHSDSRGGKHVVVVVVSESTFKESHWIVTAYLARKLVEGEQLWKRN